MRIARGLSLLSVGLWLGCSLINAPGGIVDKSGGIGGSLACNIDKDCAKLDGPCQHGVCKAGACEGRNEDDGAKCNDGKFCTEPDSGKCAAGKCVGAPKKCADKDSCNLGSCDEKTKTCLTTVKADGDACAAPDPCSPAGKCTAGMCINPSDCTKLDGECVKGTCDTASMKCGTKAANTGMACDMTNACKIAGTCQPDGTCNSGNKPDGTMCDDNDKCTSGDKCTMGKCGGPPTACPNEFPDCAMATCDPSMGCALMPMNDAKPCNPGSSCITNASCTMGKCVGMGPTVYFSDTFKDNMKGWTLDGDGNIGEFWEIKPAQASVGCSPGNQDPGQDHTQKGDNGVAGVNVGGCVNNQGKLHPYYYLTSPAFDTSQAATVFLQYYRWLNSDYLPYMHNKVEVFDGNTWQIVFQTGNGETADNSWVYQSFDVGQFKNAQMRVRFAYYINSLGFYHSSQWNVDDVLVASAACP